MNMRISTFAASLVAAAILAAPSAAQEVTLRFATEATPGNHLHYVIGEWLQEELEDASDGRMTLQIFHSGTVGNEPDIIDGMRIGTADIAPLVFGNVATVVPEYSLFSASYLFSDYDHVRRVLGEPTFIDRLDEITASKDVGLRLLGVSVLGPRFVFASRPVGSLDELQGLKMRVIPNPVETRIWDTLGAITTPMPSPEIYGAMQSGVIDGAEGSIPYIYDQKLFEVGPYVSLTRHQFALSAIMVSEQAWDQLTDEQRAILTEAAVRVADRGIDHTEAQVDDYIDLVGEQPRVEIVPVDTSEFSERVAPLHSEIAEELGASDLFEIVIDAR